MQTSIMRYVMFVLDVFCGDYVGVSDQSSVCGVSVGYVCSNGVWRTSVWWGSMEETVVRIWSGIPSCTNVFFPPSYVVVVVLSCFRVYFRC